MHISQKLAQTASQQKPTFSFEFFPPKTAQGVQNLYARWERMYELAPTFIDITFGAGGRHSQLTFEMVAEAQSTGLESCMQVSR